MHVELDRKELLALVKAVALVAKPSDLRPVLRNVLMSATEEGFSLTATDLTVSLWLHTPIDSTTILSQGKVLVQAQSFQRVLASLKSSRITLQEANGQLIARAGKAKFELVTEDVKDFPGITRFSTKVQYLTLSADVAVSAVSRVAFCAHTERSHYNMHGVIVKSDGSSIEMAATNGQRLAVAVAPVSNKVAGVGAIIESIIIPAASILIMQKVIGIGKEESLDFQWTNRGLNVRGTRGEVSMQALRGSFPPYQRGIPQNSKHIVLDRKQLVEILKQATALKTAATTFVDLTLEENKLTFQSSVPDSGKTRVECDGEWEHGTLNLVVNPDFLLQSAVAMSGDQVLLELEGVTVPTLLREVGQSINSLCVFAVARK